MGNIRSVIIDNSNRINFSNKDYESFVGIVGRTVSCFDNNYFIIVNNINHNGVPLSLLICDHIEKFKLQFIDEIIWLCDSNTNHLFRNTFKSILWFSKTKEYYFNKDILRVNHIWKDVEWGKRAENYHPLGKDPGNIWIKEYSDNATITKHIFLKTEEIYAKLILSQAEGNSEYYHIYSDSVRSVDKVRDLFMQKSKLNISIKIEAI